MPTLNGFPILDDRHAFGFQSDPEFLTTGPRLPNGVRLTNALRTVPVMKFSFTYNNQNLTDVRTIREIYYEVQGGNLPFLMKDAIKPTLINEVIGTGDGVETEFQITMKMGPNITKTLKHIENSTLKVYVNDVLQVGGVTEALGLLTFTVPPTNTHEIKVDDTGYYYKVKLDRDNFPARRVAAPSTVPVGKIENLTATEQPE